MMSSWFLHHAGRCARQPVVLLACFLALTASSGAFADTKGKLTGRIVDVKNQPVLGANVQIVGTTLGAAANEDGYYLILNVPVGDYTARVSAVGYQTNLVKEVRLSAGQTTTLNVIVAESVISMGRSPPLPRSLLSIRARPVRSPSSGRTTSMPFRSRA